MGAPSPLRTRSPVEHIIVLMLENRAFDHMLGFLPRAGHLSHLEGLTEREYNRINPFDPASQKYFVQDGALYEFYGNTLSEGPPHTLPAANMQLTALAGLSVVARNSVRPFLFFNPRVH